jgi:hypothetical protein
MELLTIALLGAVGALFVYGVLPAKWTERHGRMPVVKLAELAEGSYSRVVGRATQLEQVLVAPISGRRCLYYQVRVTRKYGDSDWQKRNICREERGVPFVLDDGSAHAIVEPTDVVANLKGDRHSGPGWCENGSDELALLARHRVKVADVQALIFVEGILEVGDTVSAVASAVRELDPDASPAAPYRGEQPTRLWLIGSPRRPLLLSDRPEAMS